MFGENKNLIVYGMDLGITNYFKTSEFSDLYNWFFKK